MENRILYLHIHLSSTDNWLGFATWPYITSQMPGFGIIQIIGRVEGSLLEWIVGSQNAVLCAHHIANELFW